MSHRGSALVVVAGPGSGKTRVLTHRVASLLEDGIAPWRILAVTFTNKAADEMRHRLAGLVGVDATQRLWVSTFHSACLRILRLEHVAAGLPRSFSIYDSDDVKRVIRDVLVSLGLATGPAARKEAGVWAAAISAAKNSDGDLVAEARRSRLPHLVAVAALYAQRMSELNALDFDDLLVRTDVLLRDPTVRDRWGTRFDAICVDEYQDTNQVQASIVNSLAGTGVGLCVVGDQAQSIYRFRGAVPDVLDMVEITYPDARVILLEENYRSTPQIVDACQAIIEASGSHRLVLHTTRPAGQPVRVVEASSDRGEAKAAVGALTRPGAALNEAAVLVRINAQTRVFEEELVSVGIPYRVVGALRFYDRAEVRDALAWLRLVANTHDAIAFARSAAAPRRGLGDKTIASITARAQEGDGDVVAAARALVEDGSLSGRAAAVVLGWLDAHDAVARAWRSGPATALNAVINQVGLAAHWAKDPAGEDRCENLKELASSAAQFAMSKGVTPDGVSIASLSPTERGLAWLEHVALVTKEDDSAGDALSILTAHAAKGREFDRVWVAGVEEDLFPHSRSTTPGALEEERRLLFVAASRARDELTFSYATRRYLFGRPIDPVPSRFLNDLPKDVRFSTGALAPAAGQRW